MIWDLRGTEAQNRIVMDALAACDYPFERLLPKLQADKAKSTIPVEWDDLSRYSQAEAAGVHEHVHENDDVAHAIKHPDYRSQVLGLAWYSGKVTLDLWLETRPALAVEVFLSEGAHMVDFFGMSEWQRQYISSVMHNFQVTEHGHGWFDVGGYRSWEGEAFMGAFIKAFSPAVPVTIPFEHPTGDAQARYIRAALLGPRVFKTKTVRYHDSHKGQTPKEWLVSALEAERLGLRPCGVCKPGPR